MLGHGVLAFHDGGFDGKGLLAPQQDNLASLYFQFFRAYRHFGPQPGLVWLLGGVPNTVRPRASRAAATLLREGRPTCQPFVATGRQRHGRVRLESVESRRIEVPAGFLAGPEPETESGPV